MSWFVNLFKKSKQKELSQEEIKQSKIKWEGFDAFERGKTLYINNQFDKALLEFDKAVFCNFEENFKEEAANLFYFRGTCLQQLEYHYDAINDFKKSIIYDSIDCNKFFSSSTSKGWIMDYEGEIDDLNKAIELSKLDSDINRAYNEEARKKGFKNITEMFQMWLGTAQLNLQSEKDDQERLEKADPKSKEYLQQLIDERKAKRLNQIKKR